MFYIIYFEQANINKTRPSNMYKFCCRKLNKCSDLTEDYAMLIVLFLLKLVKGCLISQVIVCECLCTVSVSMFEGEKWPLACPFQVNLNVVHVYEVPYTS